MRSAKVGLATRTVANAAAALRTVPAGRNQRTFLCVHYYRARISDGTAMQDFDALVRCAATTDVLRTGLHVRVSRVRRNQASACCCTAQRSKVEGRIAMRTASVHERAAQISIAHRAGHACSSSCTSGLTTFVESLRTVRGARAAESVCVRLRCAAFATRPATVELLRLLACQCNGRRAETIAASRPALVRCTAAVEVEAGLREALRDRERLLPGANERP